MPYLLSEASLPPLRVTLTHFTLSSYEQTLWLPTSFRISGLARLGVKPRLCRSSWKAFASTHPLMPSTSSREALLTYPSFPSWNLLSFTVEFTLSSTCPRSDPPLSRQGAALAHLDSLPPHDLVLWTDGSFPFPFGEGGSGVLVNCSLCGTEATLSFSAGPLFSSFSAEACAILHALCWSRQHNKSAISLLFSFYLTLVLFSPPCSLIHLFFYLKLSGRSGRNCLVSSHVLSGYNGSLETRFSQGTKRLMSWPDRERYLRSLQSLVVSLLSLVSTLLISRTGDVLSHRNSSTCRFPRFPPRNLCSLVMLAVFSRLCCNGDSLLLSSYLSMIDRMENSSCSACGHSSQDTSSHSALSSYGLFVPLALWRLFVSLRPMVQALGSCLASRAPWSSAMPPSLGRGRVIINNNNMSKYPKGH